jgi:threonine dehydratase
MTTRDDSPAESLVTLDDVRAAREVLQGVARYTPLEESSLLAAKVGGPTFLKCENLQRAGSFKARGAYVRIARLSPEERANGVVAASAGNHAQGVALAAGLLDAQAVVFMPRGAPLPKIAATRAYGAQIELVGDTVDDALTEATAYAEKTGAVLIHPFDHPDIIAGQGTVALEILEQCPEVKTILVSLGGGGLIAGIAAAAKELNPEIRIVGVQAEGAAAFPPSLRTGHPVPLTTMTTIADGIAVGCPGVHTFAHIQRYVDEVVTVTEEDISRALLFCLEREKLLVEPAGAAAVGALVTDPTRFATPLVAVLSGGNVDPLLLVRIIEHGLAAAGRYLQFKVEFADRPGTLARLLSLLGEEGANVVDVEHSRYGSRLAFGEVEVSLRVETRGNEHSEHVIHSLRTAGYHVEFD